MTIGTITLLTVLFFGGTQEYSFLDKLENGTKQFILDKERSNEKAPVFIISGIN